MIRKNINNHRHADDAILKAESEEELKNLLRRVEVESEKAGLKLNIKKAKIMASGSITSWQIEREKVKIVRNFFSWAPESLHMVTAAVKLKDACCLEEML